MNAVLAMHVFQASGNIKQLDAMPREIGQTV